MLRSKSVLLIVSLSLITNVAGASGTWEVIHHVPGANWRDVFFLDESHGWAVGEQGGVIATEDGGKNWTLLARKCDTSRRYEACFFVSEEKGWLVGYGSGKGLLAVTEDGGKTLEECGDFPGAYFFDVYFISQNEGWVVGQKDKGVFILHTKDAGKHWEVQKAGSAGYLTRVFFINEKKGFAAGGTEFHTLVLLQTDDGGRTWNKQSTPMNLGRYQDIFFLNSLEGWVVLGTSLLKTTDGGISWENIPIPQDIYLTSAWVKDSNEWLLVGIDRSSPVYSGLIMQTKDGCQSFDRQSGFSLLNAIARFGDKYWVVGNDNTIVHSQDGRNWHPQVEKAYSYKDIDFAGRDVGFLIGRSMPNCSPWGDSVIFFTNDGGNNWEEKGTYVGKVSYCLDFADDSSGWIGGTEGVYRTEDAGKTMQKDEVVTGCICDIIFTTRNQGWLLSTRGIWRTSDGGISWRETRINSGVEVLKGIDVLDRNAWVVGYEQQKGGIVCITADGGKSFKKVGVAEKLYGVSFATQDMGWAIGGRGSIFVTEDGGKHWKAQESGTSEYLSDILFLSEEEGWAVGRDGIILHTTDGGNSWMIQKSQSKEALDKIIYTGGDSLFAVGDWSTILKYTDESLLEYSKRFAVSDLKPQPVTWAGIKNCVYQNYPNPFNAETWIPFSIAKQGSITIKIYNLRGQLVRKIDLGNRKPGSYLSKGRAAYWDGKNQAGEPVSSGIYYYSILGGDFSEIKRMMLVK